MGKRASETVTENIFRQFYGAEVFTEKSAIKESYGFVSKKGTDNKGYPDFFLHDQTKEYMVVVEAKALKQSEAEDEVKWYMKNNDFSGPVVGIAISGQHLNQLKVTYFYQIERKQEVERLQVKDKLLSLENLDITVNKRVRGETVTEEQLLNTLKNLNKRFHDDKRVRNTDRSLFFSGLLIALSNNNFRSSYKTILAPTEEETAGVNASVLEAHYLNESILNAISVQLSAKINNLSKQISWRDKFSFIKNVDYSIQEYKEIIGIVEENIYVPFSHEEKQDILGKAYKTFLSRSGTRAEDRNIILTPDHIKELMVKLARLSVDDVVIDTCMGTGGFLMESMEVMVNMAKDDEEKIENIQKEQLIGFEVDDVLFALACSNMFLHGDGRSNLLYRSSILDSDQNGKLVNSTDEILFNHVKEKKPTKCIINPPYESNSPIDFTLQAIDYLEPNGKLIIIMPTPTLSMNVGGKTEELLEKAKLDFVVKMPYNLFVEQKRTVNTSIFGFTKTEHMPEDEVLYVNLKEDGFKSIQHRGRVDVDNKWNDLENEILDVINNSKEVKGLSQKKRIYIKDKEAKGYTLNPNGVGKVGKQSNVVKINEIFDIDKGILQQEKLQSSKNEEYGEYDFITAADEWKKHTTYTHDCEALVYATKAGGSLGKSQYVNGKFIPSDLVVVLTLKEDVPYEINLQFYNYYFNIIREQIVDDLATGTSKLTLDSDMLGEYYIEYFHIEEQDEFVSKHIDKYKRQKEKLKNIEKELKEGMKEIIEG